MDVLKDKKFNTFDYPSRYSTNPYYYHTVDKKYFYGLGTQTKVDNIVYIVHEIKKEDTLDKLALKYYGNPSFWWMIADFNRITDPFVKLYDHFSILKIPNFNSVEFGEER